MATMATQGVYTQSQIISIVDNAAQKYGVPKYVWYPILMQESGGNPNARLVSSKEDSRGLFQINSLVHNQYDPNKLYDPTYNAGVAFRDFISPAYNKAIANPANKTPVDIATDVYKNGIRPKWTSDLQTKFQKSVGEAVSNFGTGNNKNLDFFPNMTPDQWKKYWKEGEQKIPFPKLTPNDFGLPDSSNTPLSPPTIDTGTAWYATTTGIVIIVAGALFVLILLAVILRG